MESRYIPQYLVGEVVAASHASTMKSPRSGLNSCAEESSRAAATCGNFSRRGERFPRQVGDSGKLSLFFRRDGAFSAVPVEYGALLAVFLTLILAGCHTPAATGMKHHSPTISGIKAWIVRGVGGYNGRLTGVLNYRNSVIPVVGHLDLTNAYRFTLTLQSADGSWAFILRRNWAGSHFIVPPGRGYKPVALAIGEAVSLAFRRPEGPWTAEVKGTMDTVKYKDANDNKFQWRLVRVGRSLVLNQTRVKRPTGNRAVITYTGRGRFPTGVSISDRHWRYTLQLNLRDIQALSVMARGS